MDSSQSMSYNAGQAKGQAEVKKDQAYNAMLSAKESCLYWLNSKKEAAQQMKEKAKDAADACKDAADAYKDAAGMKK
ncbi:hypothetical protein MKX01_016789 [Papaver californicum]|nr:hypothetical protein MKX01_035475 [Papaver californicum]KAI3991028.1 hypothetical protein MKX01_016789 [Papaver californicum]